MKNWPPLKAWTSIYLIKGNRHFVAINYGIKNGNHWVNLVSVLNGELSIRVAFEDLKNNSLWLPGWEDLSIGNINYEDECKVSQEKYDFIEGCLHPSDDTGFCYEPCSQEIRKWFPD